MLIEVLVAFAIVAACVAIHTLGMLLFAEWIFRRFYIIGVQHGITHVALMLLLVFGFITLLHTAEAALWAGFYYWQSLFKDYETSLYFSLISYTTLGFGDVVLPNKWRLLGAMEGLSGTLLCGVSTAFIFAIVNALFRMRLGTTVQGRL